MPKPAIIDGTENSSRVLITAGWDDVPHLDAKARKELLDETPEWLRDARSKGIPTIGVGAIYPIKRSKIEVEPFAIPDHWPRCYALDVGWNNTAALWCAFDRESQTKYLYACYKQGQQQPSVHADAIKTRGKWIPGMIDPAARGRAQRDGEKLIDEYRDLDLDLAIAINTVEAGLVACWRDMNIGRTKVFSTLEAFWQEFGLYHRDENGKIVKKNDHLMDCMRYIHNTGPSVWKIKPAKMLAANITAPLVGPGGY
jgi:hypothetical protein